MSKVLNEMEVIRASRLDSYGAPEDSFRMIGDYWETYLNSLERCDDVGTIHLTPENVGMLMVLLKVARTVGGADKLDNYVDAANYAAIVGDMKNFEETTDED